MVSLFSNAIVWIFAAAVLGFEISAIFAGRLQFSRRRFLIVYVSLAAVFLLAFFLNHQIDLAALLSNHWGWGLLFALPTSLFLVRNVRSQPASRQHSGPALGLDLAWSGLVYGLVDAFFLNVMPVVAVSSAAAQYAWASTLGGKVLVAAGGLLASLFVTFAYHWGYPEFRNRSIFKVLVGNGVITLAFLLSGSPLGSLVSHPVMHIAAVLQGAETTLQLPPHYQAGFKPG